MVFDLLLYRSALGKRSGVRTEVWAQDFTHNVDPFIGVDWGGNTFVGSAIPFGMVKLGPDMATFDNRHSGFGYFSAGNILGFSHLHLSGAQGKYGNILVAPVTGALDLTDMKTPRTDEVARVGYYSARLSRYNVEAELTSSRRVGFHRYTFPASPQSHITVNVASALGPGSGDSRRSFSEPRFTCPPIARPRVSHASKVDGTKVANTRFITTWCSILQPLRHNTGPARL